MKGLIARYKGELLRTRGDAFTTLARAIVGQQISVKAAASVWARLEAALLSSPWKGEDQGGGRIQPASAAEYTSHAPHPTLPLPGGGDFTPLSALSTPDETLRACGLSGRKVRYMKSLAEHFLDHPNPDWPSMTDEQAITFLTQVKGIGRWSAEMFLIFHLLRPDVWPVDDIGLQKGLARHYNRDKPLSRAQLVKLGKRFAPWRSVATWYLWRALDPLPVEY
jgi:DNA-3-methyladenine glycosylase II